jgi:plastocyanin
MKLMRILTACAAVMLLATAAVACGDDDDAGDGAQSPVATQPGAAETEPAPEDTAPAAEDTAPAGEASIAVTSRDFQFDPASLEAAAGSPVTVTLSNEGQFPHTVKVFEDEAFTTAVAGADTGVIQGGASGDFTVTFGEAKVYHFRCAIHPTQMQGTITVE